jgi:hypothetical protein
MLPIQSGAGAIDYLPCRYGQSRALFRGPARCLSGRYAAVLGGSATFGKHVAQPFPDLLEGGLGCPVANLGAQNAGPDFYLADPGVLDVAARAQLAVVQLGGADGVSNPFYTVHPRRNDRFLGVTPALRGLFPEVDFAEIHFTRHLLSVLYRTDAARFQTVAQVLRSTWVGRMQELLVHLPPRRILLSLGRPAPAGAVPPEGGVLSGAGPFLVDSRMIARLQSAATVLVEVGRLSSLQDELAGNGPFAGIDPAIDPAQARSLPGPGGHRTIAAGLLPQARAFLPQARLAPLILRGASAAG